MNERTTTGRRTPYTLTEPQLEALKAKCRARTTRRPQAPRPSLRRIGWAAAAAVALCAGGLWMAEELRPHEEIRPATVDELISELPDDLLRQIAERSYDDCLTHDQL